MRRKELFYLALGVALLGLATGLIGGAGLLPQRTAAATVAESVSNAQTRPETLVVRLYFKNNIERDYLAQQWDAAEVPTTNGYLTVWVDRNGYNQMLRQGLKVEIDEATTRLANNPNLFGNESPNTFYGGYKTVEEMQAFLDQMVAAYPTLAQKVDIGDSWCKVHPGSCTQPNASNGYDLWALRITNQAIAGPKPVFWYDAGIHSREIAVPEIAMLYISWLLDGYNSDADARWMVDYQDIWVIPMFNPDGHHIVESGGGGSNPYYQRKNANNTNGCTTWPPTVSTQFGTDNNRNFPFKFACCGGSSNSPCTQTYRGPTANSEPETQAVVNQVSLLIPDQRGPNDTDAAPITTTGVYQNMHSNGALNLYPWGWTGSPAPNNTELSTIGKHMQAANAYPPGNSYQACASPNCLYVVDGDATSWAYGALGAASYTTEVGGSDFLVPLAYTTGTLWPANRGALIYQGKIARAPYLLAHGPDASGVALTPMTVTVGTPSQLAGTINFAWTGNSLSQNVGAAEYYIDTPPWAGGTAIPMTGSFTSPTVSVQATVNTTSLSVGRHIIFVRGRGVADFSGYQTWGPVTAAWLWVQPMQGTPTPTVTGTPPTATRTSTPTNTVPVTNTPTATATPCVAAPIEGFESGTLGTYTSTVGTCVPGGCGWASVNTAAHSGTRSAFAPDLPNITDQYLTTISAVSVPAGATLSFWHNWDLESGFDGAVLEFSTNGGSTWTDGGALITMNGYNGSISSSFQSPISGRQAWTGNPNGTTFVESRANLSSFAGQNLLIRFRTADDNSVSATGWWVDDIAILGPCVTPTPGTPSPTRTNTPPPTSAATSTATPTAIPTTCPVQFNDVPVGSTFYDFIRCLACRGIVGGYPCGGPGEPCPGNYFRPNNNVTRGQVSKIVSESAGFAEVVPSTQWTFQDVPPSGTFWLWVERLSGRGIIGGYACGSNPFEPCVAPNNRPYFRPNNDVTRGQLSKIVSGAAGWTETPTGQTFEDVAVGSTFYVYVERVASRGIVNGYPCGGVGEPCVAPGNRAYFRPFNNATRGQMSKIAASAFFPGCSTPAKR